MRNVKAETNTKFHNSVQPNIFSWKNFFEEAWVPFPTKQWSSRRFVRLLVRSSDLLFANICCLVCTGGTEWFMCDQGQSRVTGLTCCPGAVLQLASYLPLTCRNQQILVSFNIGYLYSAFSLVLAYWYLTDFQLIGWRGWLIMIYWNLRTNSWAKPQSAPPYKKII